MKNFKAVIAMERWKISKVNNTQNKLQKFIILLTAAVLLFANNDVKAQSATNKSKGKTGVRIFDITPNLIQKKNLNKDAKGIYIGEVEAGGAAAEAGIKVGDVITKLNGKEINSTDDFQDKRSKDKPGDTIILTVIRDGKENKISVTLKSEEEDPEVELITPKPTRNNEIIVSTKEMEANGYELLVEGNITGYITGLEINYQEVKYNYKENPNFSASINIYEEERLFIAWSDVNGVSYGSSYKIILTNVLFNIATKHVKVSTTDTVSEEPQYRGGGDPLKGLNVSKSKESLEPGNYYALIIGIDNYQGQWLPLKNAVNDGKTVETTLKANYKFDKIRSLYNEKATRKNIIKELEWLADTVQEKDNVLIYYSGHGEYKKQLDKGYWVPVDAQTQSTSDYISNSDIQIFLKGIKSKHTLLVSDACFSGDIFRGNTVSIPFEDSQKYYANVYNLPSRQALTSGGIEPVMDNGNEGHSVFAYYFLRTLKNNTGKYLDASQLYNSIKVPVINNSEQSPGFNAIKNTGDEGGQFVFIKK